MNKFNMYWDTLGWVYFQMGDLPKAEKYLDAAWKLGQSGEVADHLARVYEKQGKRDEAIATLRLALASNSGIADARERLKDLGASENVPVQVAVTTNDKIPVARGKPYVSSAEELGRLRTTGIPSLTVLAGSAEFFILFSRDKVEETLFISGDAGLREAGKTLSKARFDVAFPDDGSERIARRGILSCSKYTTPSCQITMLLPSTTKK